MIRLETPRSRLLAYPIDWDELLARCAHDTVNKLHHHPEIIVYGRQCRQRRDVGFFSDESVGYHYSGQVAAAQPLTPDLRALLLAANSLSGGTFNGILVNHYADGTETIGKHSDDEDFLDPVGVACVSMGAARKFRIRDKKTGKIVADLKTTSAELWVMTGDFQKEFTHEIPVERKVRGARTSFTFRKHNK